MLPLFRQPTQLGLLGPLGDADMVSFDVLVQYMEKSQKVSNVIGISVPSLNFVIGVFSTNIPWQYHHWAESFLPTCILF